MKTIRDLLVEFQENTIDYALENMKEAHNNGFVDYDNHIDELEAQLNEVLDYICINMIKGTTNKNNL